MTAAEPRVGRLRHRLTIEAASTAADGSVAWTPVDTVWAAIEPIGGGEREAAGAMAGVATHRITIRHRADVDSAARMTRSGRIFRIVSAFDPREDGRFLVLVAEEERR